MSKLEEDKEIIKLEKTLTNTRGQSDFVREVRMMDKQQLDQKLLDLAKYSQNIKSTMKMDDKLIDAQNVVKGLKKAVQ